MKNINQEEIVLEVDAAKYFQNQLRLAREKALKDAESYEQIIHVIEKFGYYISKKEGNIAIYKPKILEIVKLSDLNNSETAEARAFHTPFSELYEIVRVARNDAFHIGAFARHLTKHAIQLAIILEDALRIKMESKNICDFMVRDPICAELWQPISFIRQQMLANSFSYLPVKEKKGNWVLISDLEIVKYLQEDRKNKLASKLEDATSIERKPAKIVKSSATIEIALKDFDGSPILVFHDDQNSELLGIVTAFDLL